VAMLFASNAGSKALYASLKTRQFLIVVKLHVWQMVAIWLRHTQLYFKFCLRIKKILNYIGAIFALHLLIIVGTSNGAVKRDVTIVFKKLNIPFTKQVTALVAKALVLAAVLPNTHLLCVTCLLSG
jgi:hypothetical protein